MHGLLVFVLIFGTAFFSSKEKPIDSPHILELVPGMTVTDGRTHGGGGVPAQAPAPSPPPVQKPAEPISARPDPKPEREPEHQKPVVQPLKPKPEPRETVSELPTPKPKKTKEKPAPAERPKPSAKPTPTKPTVDISKPIIRDTKQKQALAEAAERAAQERIQHQRLSALAGARRNLEKNLSDGPPIEALGAAGGMGGGGAAEINYRDLVFSKYDAAWIAPDDVDDDEANTKVRVVIARNGNVISADVIKASGNAKLDKSVRRTLDSLRYIHPFPESSRDSQRTFIINFNLKSKRGIG